MVGGLMTGGRDSEKSSRRASERSGGRAVERKESRRAGGWMEGRRKTAVKQADDIVAYGRQTGGRSRRAAEGKQLGV